jgi:hypothetical protein
MAGSCGHGDELLGSIKGGEFLDQLIDYKLLRKYSAPRSSQLDTVSPRYPSLIDSFKRRWIWKY